MTKKESEKALELYNKLETIVFFHNKNLTKQQYYFFSGDLVDFLREISEKAYRSKKAKEREAK